MTKAEQAEQTRMKILEVSIGLFAQKGYEKTSIQDILNVLGMSKGAVYHHFKSKKEILDSILELQASQNMAMLSELTATIEAADTKELLQKLLLSYMTALRESVEINSVAEQAVKDPHMMVENLRSVVVEDAVWFKRMFERGIADGSLATEYPRECAEIFLLLLNMWNYPQLFGFSRADVQKKLRFLKHNMERLGVDIVTEETIAVTLALLEDVGSFGINDGAD